jgi:hypothetical protein
VLERQRIRLSIRTASQQGTREEKNRSIADQTFQL